MHAFLRSRGLAPLAAVVGALAWLGAAPMLIHKASNVLWPLVWLPLIWRATDRVIDRVSDHVSAASSAGRRTWRAAIGLGGAIYLSASAGSPPGFFYALILASLYGCYRVAIATIAAAPGDRARFAARLGAAMAIAAAVAVATTAITIVPGLALADATMRPQNSTTWALRMPMPVADTLVGLLAPAAANKDAYVGVAVLALTAVALTRSARSCGGLPIFFAVAATFSLVLAFGDATPALRWLVVHVPGFRLFRIANRYKLLFAPAIAVIAAFGADSLLRRPRARPAMIAALSVFALALVIAIVKDAPAEPIRPLVAAPITCALVVGLIAGALRAPPRAAPIFVSALAGLLFFEPAYTLFARGPVMERRPSVAKEAALDVVDDRAFRIFDEFVVGERPGSRYQVRDFRGYPSGDPLDFRRYREVLAQLNENPELLEAYNVHWVLSASHHRNGFRAHRVKPAALSGSRHFRRAAQPNVWLAEHPAPLSAWVGAAVVVPRERALDAMIAAESASGARDVAILEPQDASLLTTPLPTTGQQSVAGRLISFSANRVEVEIDAPARGLVIVNEVFYPGWNVRVDSASHAPLRANYLLRAVEVEAGHHRITWTYEPPHQRLWAILFVLGLVAILIAAASTIWTSGNADW